MWDVFEEMRRMHEEMEREMERVFGNRNSRKLLPAKSGEKGKQLAQVRYPTCEVQETEKNVGVTIELPGAEKKDIELNITEDMLEVKVDKTQKKETKEKGKHMYAAESRSYYRRFTLPATVDPDKAKAGFKNGLLRIEIPKEKPKPKGKRIQIE